MQFQSKGSPVHYVGNPDGVCQSTQRQVIEEVARLNGFRAEQSLDPEIQTRVAQYELAFKMQTTVPDLADMSSEPPSIRDLYGVTNPGDGSFASNCLLARRLAERGVRFIQLYHRGWDQHGNLPNDHRLQCKDTDQPCYGLLTDLKQRGLLDDTLVIWAGEFGRTVYSQGTLTQTNYGRDHHPRCFSIWMAGGGVKRGVVHGETDDYSYNIVRDPVSLHDLNATILHCLGIDHSKFTFKSQGLDQRLTSVEPASVVKAILA